MKTVAIVSQKGGSGKTTIAVHLAVCAERAGKVAAIIDLDPQASPSNGTAGARPTRLKSSPQPRNASHPC